MRRNAHILLVEDNIADSHLVSKAFKERHPGTEVFIAENGTIGSDYLFRRGAFASGKVPDLVVLDLNLPGKDGREVLREIKADNRLKSIPVIMFTSSEAPLDIQSCYEAGANAYFSKPADLDEFFSVIDVIHAHWIQKAKLPLESSGI